MKPAAKIALLFGAATVALGVTLWLGSPSRPPHQLAPVTPTTTPRRANRPPPTVLPARITPSLLTSAAGPIPVSVQPIVSAASPSSYAERVAKIHALPANLTTPEVHALYRYLLAPSPANSENRQEENWLRNELMDKLTSQTALPKDSVQVLVAIYQDPAQDIVMRDYAVQHMRPAYAQAGAEERATLQQALWTAVAETGSSIAGTALLALRDLAQDPIEIEPNQVGEAALALAGDDRSGELSRITAVQICGRMGLNQATPLLLQLAQTARSVPLQIASIAALGDVGDEPARNYLRQLASQADPRFRPALDTALKKMNKRQGV